MSKDKKLSEKEFLAILRENGGLFARTAKAIEDKYECTYTRQAVRDRAEKHPKELEDIEDEMLDIAEGELHKMIKEEKSSRIRLRAVELYLKTKGKKRGYVERIENKDVDKIKTINVVYHDKMENGDSTG